MSSSFPERSWSPAIVWGRPEDRFYESGVDRGVLYVRGLPGVPWNGLVSVRENPDVQAPMTQYMDGVKYLHHVPDGEFSATIEALYSPVEFDLCDGTAEIHTGLYVTNISPKPFDLTYRTMINETDYKIHLVYNCRAIPAARNYSTRSHINKPETITWTITTKPEVSNHSWNQAHFMIDTTKTPPRAVEAIERMLYGSEGETPRMPALDDVYDIYDDALGLTIIDHGDGTWTASGPDDLVYMIDDTKFGITWSKIRYISPDTYEIQQ